MSYGSTNGLACQDPSGNYAPISRRNLVARCTYCWSLRTGLTKDGYFVSYRVFCHHPGCPEWQRVHACLEAAPLVRWEERAFAEIQGNKDFMLFRQEVRDQNWLGIPRPDGNLVVFVEKPGDLGDLGFKRSSHTRGEIETLIQEVPEHLRLRKPTKEKSEKKQEEVGIPVKPDLNFVLSGMKVEELEKICRELGIPVYRVGVYLDCIESQKPLTMIQAISLAEKLHEYLVEEATTDERN